MQLPTSLYLSNSLDQCVSVGKSLHTIRHILEPHFYTREIHRSLLANWSLQRDIDFHLTVFDDYQRNLKYYYSIDDELVDGIAEITLFNLISSTSEFCMNKTINNWYRLFLAKRYVDDLPKLKKLLNLKDKAHKTIVQHSMLAKCALGGRLPYFEVSFPLTLALPIKAGIYTLSKTDIYYFKVRHFKDNTRNSMFGDRNFSWVTIAFWGIIETTGVGDFDFTKCIELVNEIMTVAKLSDESLRVFMLDEHNLYEFRMTQYSPDGNIIRVHQPVSQLTTLFGLANDDESVHTRQEAKDSSQIISQLKNNTLQIYDRLYASALIDKGNNNYTSSFYQLNSSIESLITHSLREVYLHRNKLREFEVFMYGDNDRVPSNYAQLKELRKQVNLISQGVISNKDRNQLEEYLNIFKGKDRTGVLRNRLVHGSEHTVNKETLFRSFDAYKAFKVTLESKLRQVI